MLKAWIVLPKLLCTVIFFFLHVSFLLCFDVTFFLRSQRNWFISEVISLCVLQRKEPVSVWIAHPALPKTISRYIPHVMKKERYQPCLTHPMFIKLFSWYKYTLVVCYPCVQIVQKKSKSLGVATCLCFDLPASSADKIALKLPLC